MRIGIEAQRIFRKNKHGMDFVALEFIRELQHIDTPDEYFVFVAPGDDVCLASSKNVHIIELKCPSYPLWEQVALPMAVCRYKIDLLHCTSNTAPIFCRVPLVLTLHDVIFLELRQEANKSLYQNLGRVYRRLVVPRILKKCSKIVTVSESEKKTIESTLCMPGDKLEVVYNGYSEHFKPMHNAADVAKKYIDADEYLFFLGNTDPKKNVPGTLKAYSLYLERSKKKLPLLIADIKEPILDEILKEIGCSHIRSHIVMPGYIPNKELPYIYGGAKVFLYTSFRESFGIPMLEAMACGTPIVAGDKSAMPEIAGDGAVLVDVSSPSCVADAILRLETDTEYYDEQVRYGLERVKHFSWRHTAERMLHLYDEILNNKKH